VDFKAKKKAISSLLPNIGIFDDLFFQIIFSFSMQYLEKSSNIWQND